MAKHNNRRPLSEILHLDWPLFLALLSLLTASLVILYSASGEDADALLRQGIGWGNMPLPLVAADVAARWTDRLLELDLKTADGAAFALAQLARATGDRARDLDSDRRELIAGRLEKAGAPAAWAQMVRDVVILSVDDEAAAWGEALPVGLRL